MLVFSQPATLHCRQLPASNYTVVSAEREFPAPQCGPYLYAPHIIKACAYLHTYVYIGVCIWVSEFT